jgi:hypothetical protein
MEIRELTIEQAKELLANVCVFDFDDLPGLLRPLPKRVPHLKPILGVSLYEYEAEAIAALLDRLDRQVQEMRNCDNCTKHCMKGPLENESKG